MSHLFEALQIREVSFRNRIFVSPMCQYSSVNGYPNDWHLVHLGSRAVGGAGLVMFEATAVSPEGRISPDDNGIWSDQHVSSYKRINAFINEQGSMSGIQLAHAGRKASTASPWKGGGIVGPSQGGWSTVSSSAVAFAEGWPTPSALDPGGMAQVIRDFESATERSLEAGFQVVEIHMAHGYLLHQFLSPISNRRTDDFGGSLENRMRFPLEVARAVRKKWPAHLPLFVRISATDWVKGAEELIPPIEMSAQKSSGWNLSDSIEFCRELKKIGVDLIDCSTGGTLPNAVIPVGAGYQVPFAESIRKSAEILSAAVGMITDPAQAESILMQKQADAVFIAREFLRNPYWPMLAARTLGAQSPKPKQYGRA